MAPHPAGPRQRGWRSHLAGLAAALVGGPLTLAGVLGLNDLSQAPPPTPAARQVSFEVKPPAPPPPPPQGRRRPPPPTAQRRSAAPPPPALSEGLSGVDLGVSGFELGDLGEVSQELIGDLEDVVHTEETVDSRPTLREQTPLEVPPEARAKHLSGRVVLSLLIGKDGRVQRIKVLSAEPPLFADAARRGVSEWTFEPATYRGSPVDMWATLPIEFAP